MGTIQKLRSDLEVATNRDRERSNEVGVLKKNLELAEKEKSLASAEVSEMENKG